VTSREGVTRGTPSRRSARQSRRCARTCATTCRPPSTLVISVCNLGAARHEPTVCHAITLRADAMASPMGMRAQSAARRRYPLCENVHGRDGRARRSRCAACTPTWGSMSGSRRHPDAHRAPSPSEAAAADAESHHDVKLRPVNMPNGYIRLGPIFYFFCFFCFCFRVYSRINQHHPIPTD
jgi:hypothetical protein